MREIKFRAWDTTFKRYYYDVIVSSTVVIAEYINDTENNNLDLEYYTCSNNKSSEPFIVQQYTGLNDKNNDPIYEGDIVKGIFKIRTGTRVSQYKRQRSTFAEYTDMEVVGVVIFNESLAAFYFDTDFKQKYRSNFFRGMGRTESDKKANEWTDAYDSPKDYLSKVIHKIEIIGNVYSNSELLSTQ